MQSESLKQTSYVKISVPLPTSANPTSIRHQVVEMEE